MSNAAKSLVASRPISPHLSVFKLYYTMVMSGLHRITGLGMVVGIPFFAWWILSAAAGEEAFASTQWFWASPIGLLFLFGWTFCLFYHLANGIRHMLWDIGIGLEIEGIKTGGIVMAGSAVVMTVLAWIVAIASW